MCITFLQGSLLNLRSSSSPEAPPLPPPLPLPPSSSQSPGQAPPPDTPTVKHLNESPGLHLGAWVPQTLCRGTQMTQHQDRKESGHILCP